MVDKCRACGESLPTPTRGRRREYCTLACRRALELRRRAWDRAYEHLYAATLDPSSYFRLLSDARAEFEAFTREHPRP